MILYHDKPKAIKQILKPCILVTGFETGSIFFNDAVNTTGGSTGTLPAGEFGANTTLEFCCRDDGFVSSPMLNLPSDQPLILFMTQQSGSCQEIAGKNVSTIVAHLYILYAFDVQ